MPATQRRPKTRRVVMGSLIGRIAALLAVFTIAVYAGIYFRTQDLVTTRVREQAHSYTDLIIHSRAWNSRYGGVYVEKKPGVQTNPYLERLGVDPDIVTEDGRVYTLRNPAMMTNEIARMFEQESGVAFQLTSLDPVNPDNAPDEWERERLEEFESTDLKEYGEIVDVDGRPMYRYMVPLVVEDACLTCHGVQGYSTGEIRGALSVSIPYERVRSELRLNAVGLAALAVLTLVGIVSVVYVMSVRVVERLEEAEAQLEHLAVTDPLTELWNRRHILDVLKKEFERSRRQGHDLGLIMLDLDHFKDVNDKHGHAVGDLVLRAAAQRMQAVIRDYDTLGRFGGEEFLVVVPETKPDDVASLAERIRRAVSAEPVSGTGEPMRITVSAGVAMLEENDLTPDAVLARADGALYAAKRRGRDCVVVGEGVTP